MELKTVEKMRPNAVLDLTLCTVADIEAIITVHNELPKDENGVGSRTIRQLCEMAQVRVDEILLEYVCAFGSHGVPVLRRIVSRHAQGGDEAKILEMYTDRVQKKCGELRAML